MKHVARILEKVMYMQIFQLQVIKIIIIYHGIKARAFQICKWKNS